LRTAIVFDGEGEQALLAQHYLMMDAYRLRYHLTYAQFLDEPPEMFEAMKHIIAFRHERRALDNKRQGRNP
jgi:hypothetical protein